VGGKGKDTEISASHPSAGGGAKKGGAPLLRLGGGGREKSEILGKKKKERRRETLFNFVPMILGSKGDGVILMAKAYSWHERKKIKI